MANLNEVQIDGRNIVGQVAIVWTQYVDNVIYKGHGI